MHYIDMQVPALANFEEIPYSDIKISTAQKRQNVWTKSLYTVSLLEIFTKCLKNRLRVKTKGKAKDPYSLHHVFSYFNQNCSHLFKISKFCVKRINTSVHFFNKRLSLITEPNL